MCQRTSLAATTIERAGKQPTLARSDGKQAHGNHSADRNSTDSIEPIKSIELKLIQEKTVRTSTSTEVYVTTVY